MAARIINTRLPLETNRSDWRHAVGVGTVTIDLVARSAMYLPSQLIGCFSNDDTPACVHSPYILNMSRTQPCSLKRSKADRKLEFADQYRSFRSSLV